MNNQINFLLQQAINSFHQGNISQTKLLLNNVLKIQPKNFHALHIMGVTLGIENKHSEALNLLLRAVKINPSDNYVNFNLAKALSETGNDLDSIKYHQAATRIAPKHSVAWLNFGKSLFQLNHYDEALTKYDKAIELKPDYAEAWSNKGVTLYVLRRYDEALANFDEAIQLKPDYAEAWSNKGVTLHDLRRYDEALSNFDEAIQLKPDYAEAWFNKGATLNKLKRYDEALTNYEQTIQLKPDYAEAWSNKGVTLNEIKQYEEAIAHYDKAIRFKPDIDWASGDLLHTKMKICSWSDLTESLDIISKKLETDKKVVSPFALLSLTDDSLLHKKCSEIFAEAKYPPNSTLGFIHKSSKRKKIRIAYFSSDFRSHPVSFLTSELFEIHNRQCFEVFAFSLQKAPISDETNLRLRRGFDKFLDVENMLDKEIAKMAREYQVDIAIDLTGPTQNYRTEIFSYRAAPIQVNWLGYPGTMGAGFMDYIVADKTIIPESNLEFYVEKIVHLPDTYMVDDSKRIASQRIFTKKECGLPEKNFVFCCFNNGYKFNPQILDSWVRILFEVKNSVLWVSENNEYFKANIAAEFEKRGLDRSRLIFAKRVELMADHLARYSLADLFLDTNPYNAHTTAVDSLKAGIPVLTIMGQSFASRVTASLLNAIVLPELITTNQEAYEALAIELAMNPRKLLEIKLKLINNRLTTPLFDTPLFAKNLEVAYTKMYDRYQAGLGPDHIFIS